jgi:hypothetical protein
VPFVSTHKKKANHRNKLIDRWNSHKHRHAMSSSHDLLQLELVVLLGKLNLTLEAKML